MKSKFMKTDFLSISNENIQQAFLKCKQNTLLYI